MRTALAPALESLTVASQRRCPAENASATSRKRRRAGTRPLGAVLARLLLVAGVALVSCTAPEKGDQTAGTESPVSVHGAVTCDASRREGSRRVGRNERSKYSRMIGGKPSAEGAWPWTVALMKQNGEVGCGGALIAPDWVLSAAHCDTKAGDLALVGRQDLRSAGGEEHRVAYVLVHGQFDATWLYNDIALVKLEGRSKQTSIELVRETDADLKPDVEAVVVGWGYVSADELSSQVLREAPVPIVSSRECNHTLAGNVQKYGVICTGGEDGGPSTCTGDSGGPLMVPTPNGMTWQQVGITSFDNHCGETKPYGVYTRVSRYLEWIRACKATPPA